MKITRHQLRRIIREALEIDAAPTYDREKGRSFNDPTTYPEEILRLTKLLKKNMRLPDPAYRHSLSGREDPPDYALAKALNTIQSLAKELDTYFEEQPQ
jgi:hypothetical protein